MHHWITLQHKVHSHLSPIHHHFPPSVLCSMKMSLRGFSHIHLHISSQLHHLRSVKGIVLLEANPPETKCIQILLCTRWHFFHFAGDPSTLCPLYLSIIACFDKLNQWMVDPSMLRFVSLTFTSTSFDVCSTAPQLTFLPVWSISPGQYHLNHWIATVKQCTSSATMPFIIRTLIQ